MDSDVVRAACDLAMSSGGTGDSEALRLQLAKSLGEWDGPEAGRALGTLAAQAANDSWMRAAILSSSLPHAREVAAAIAERGVSERSGYVAPLLRLALATEQNDVITAFAARWSDVSTESNRAETYVSLATFLDGLSAGGSSLGALRDRAILPDSVVRSIERILGGAADVVAECVSTGVGASVGARASRADRCAQGSRRRRRVGSRRVVGCARDPASRGRHASAHGSRPGRALRSDGARCSRPLGMRW